MWFLNPRKLDLPTPDQALKGRAEKMPVPSAHFVNRHPLDGPWPEGTQLAMFGMGCFWGAEKKFWNLAGVYSTAVGYAAGATPNPNYKEVCTGKTGHNEVVRVAFDPAQVSYSTLLKVFFESHDPTQGMRQGNDVGTNYRSGIYCFGGEQKRLAEEARAAYEKELQKAELDPITTELLDAPQFYFAEEYHQQYLAKNPDGYCGLGGTGVSCPIGLKSA